MMQSRRPSRTLHPIEGVMRSSLKDNATAFDYPIPHARWPVIMTGLDSSLCPRLVSDHTRQQLNERHFLEVRQRTGVANLSALVAIPLQMTDKITAHGSHFSPE